MSGTREGALKGAPARAAAKIGISVDRYKERIANGERWCWQCRLWKPVDDFRERWRGSGIRHAQCNPCHRDRMRPLMQRRYHGFAVAGPQAVS